MQKYLRKIIRFKMKTLMWTIEEEIIYSQIKETNCMSNSADNILDNNINFYFA